MFICSHNTLAGRQQTLCANRRLPAAANFMKFVLVNLSQTTNAPEKIISLRNIVILVDFPHISCRMPVQCSSVYHRFCGAAVMCKSAHGLAVLPFVPSPNNRTHS